MDKLKLILATVITTFVVTGIIYLILFLSGKDFSCGKKPDVNKTEDSLKIAIYTLKGLHIADSLEKRKLKADYDSLENTKAKKEIVFRNNSYAENTRLQNEMLVPAKSPIKLNCLDSVQTADNVIKLNERITLLAEKKNLLLQVSNLERDYNHCAETNNNLNGIIYLQSEQVKPEKNTAFIFAIGAGIRNKFEHYKEIWKSNFNVNAKIGLQYHRLEFLGEVNSLQDYEIKLNYHPFK